MKFIVCEPKEDSVNNQKICITGHIDEFDIFRIIMDDILSCRACNIYVSMEERDEETKEERSAILKEMNLVVCVVSRRFLEDPSCLGRKDMECAIRNKIPVLPIAVNPDLENLFNHICGDIHLLNRNSDRYRDMLRERINEVSLDANVDLYFQTMGAFSGEIFLSYRKRNYAYASKLIHRLHQMESCQDVSIWYDDFLCLGEDYSEEIENRIKFCNVFLLMVTPNLLEEHNYVLEREFPLAKELGKTIIAIEVVPTDLIAFKEKFEGAPEPIKLQELDRFETLLIENKKSWNSTSYIAEIDKLYFLGMAYCYGMHVEKNKTLGIELLEKASEQGSLKAISRMMYLYSLGEGVQKDYKKVIALRARVEEQLESLENVSYEDATFLGKILRDACDVYLVMNDLEKVEADLKIWGRVLAKGEDLSAGRTAVHIRYGHLFYIEKDYVRAEKAYELAEEDLKPYDWLPEKQVFWSLYAQIYTFRAILHQKIYDEFDRNEYLYKAIEELEKARELIQKLDRAYVDKEYDVTGIERMLKEACAKKKKVDLQIEAWKKERESFWDLYTQCDKNDMRWQEYLSGYVFNTFYIANDLKERKQSQEAAPYYNEVCRFTEQAAMQGEKVPGIMYAFACVGMSRVAPGRDLKVALLQKATEVHERIYQRYPNEAILDTLFQEINEELNK